MNTLQIDYFLMIADSESFTAAAQKLHISQPAVSRVIAALENELGCVLFDRQNHKAAVLTPAGRMFYDTFHQIRQSISDTIQKVNELTETKSGTFSIGVRSGLDISMLVAKLLERFSQRYPGITIQIDSYEHQELRSALSNYRIDAAIIMEDQLYPMKDIKTHLLWDSPRLLLYSRRHPLACQEGLTPASFRDTLFLAVEDSQSELWVSRYCESYGFKPKVVQVPSVEAMIMGIASLQGVGIFAGMSRVRTNTEFGYLRLDSNSRIVFAWLPYCSNPLLDIIKHELTLVAASLSESIDEQAEGGTAP